MPVLPDEEDAPVREDWQDNGGPGVGDYFTGRADAPGFQDFIAAHTENWTFVNNLTAQDPGMGGFFVGHVSSEKFGDILADDGKTAQTAMHSANNCHERSARLYSRQASDLRR